MLKYFWHLYYIAVHVQILKFEQLELLTCVGGVKKYHVMIVEVVQCVE